MRRFGGLAIVLLIWTLPTSATADEPASDVDPYDATGIWLPDGSDVMRWVGSGDVLDGGSTQSSGWRSGDEVGNGPYLLANDELVHEPKYTIQLVKSSSSPDPSGLLDEIRHGAARLQAATGVSFTASGTVKTIQESPDTMVPPPGMIYVTMSSTTCSAGAAACGGIKSATRSRVSDALYIGSGGVWWVPTTSTNNQDAIMLHELGHAVGLLHVSDATQVMHSPVNSQLTDYQSGDKQGLDVLSKGGRADFQGRGDPGLDFHSIKVPINGKYTPLSGDFNGDNRDDIFWYAAGSDTDVIYWGPATGGWSRTIEINGNYRPVVGNFDSDCCDDIWWYQPGTGKDVIYWGTTTESFAATEEPISDDGFLPFSGDFNGDGYDDVFWYEPGKDDDVIYWGRSQRKWTRFRFETINGTYKPLAGNFDGDCCDDILWYAPGSAEDVMYWGSPHLLDGAPFASTDFEVNRGYRPAVANFDGSGGDDIIWYRIGVLSDVIWRDIRRSGSVNGDQITIGGDFRPITGDFNGGGYGDFFGYRAGS